MKTIGLIGGMSWESTANYYQIINKTVQEKLGGFHSAKCILYSLDFHEIEKNQSNGEWDKNAKILSEAATSLEKSGADFIIICTNTMHKIADKIAENINIPILHIAEVTANELIKEDISDIALLGTIYTMEQDFYKEKLINKGINVIVPDKLDMEIINNIIFKELCLGITLDESREKFINIIKRLEDKGAKGVILGCTEIGMLIKKGDTNIPLFDTTEIHAKNAVIYSL